MPAAADAFCVSGRFAADVPTDAANLVPKARDALRDAIRSGRVGRSMDIAPHLPAGILSTDTAFRVSIHLEKSLPVASGIGGGSSDAAATLKALARLWRLGCSDAELEEIAAPLGADLPMCMAAQPLVASGTGDIVQPLEDFPSLALVLVNPLAAISTAEIFAALENRQNPPLPPLPPAMDVAALARWLRMTRNDLETPALPTPAGDRRAVAELTGAGALMARMSGSGATCFGLFADTAQAEAAAARIAAARPGWFVAATQTASLAEGARPCRGLTRAAPSCRSTSPCSRCRTRAASPTTGPAIHWPRALPRPVIIWPRATSSPTTWKRSAPGSRPGRRTPASMSSSPPAAPASPAAT